MKIGWWLMALGTMVGAARAAEAEWPLRDLFVRSLVASVQPTLDSQDPATGRFGSEPWICSDQNVVFPLAVAWWLDDPANPWHHDPKLLEAIMAGGDALVDDQDANGMWTFRKKDNSTWGQIHMPWTYSRWIRAFELIRDAMPAERRAKWEQGLLLGFTGIRKYMDGRVHNIPTHHAMALYIAGQVFDNAEWREAATAFMKRVVEEQNPAGFWSENFGPVVGYNKVYVEALGAYYAASGDPVALEALQRSARFHASVLWPDGSAVSAIDERQIYHDGRDAGNVGFSFTAIGRGYLVQQLTPYVVQGTNVGGEYAAAMLRHAGDGPVEMPPATQDSGHVVLGDNEAMIVRDKPWQWAYSAYATKPIKSRWIQDRQNLVDIYHDRLGLVVGGGNTKIQPYWSTFTVGDPELLRHTPGDEKPNFVPDIDLQWYPDSAALAVPRGQVGPTLLLDYAGIPCSVTAAPQPDGSMAVTYRAQVPAGKRVEAHVPLLWRGANLRLGNGTSVRLGEEEQVWSAAEVAGSFDYADLSVTVPPNATLRGPARQHNPYTKDGRSGLAAAKLVIVLPFGEGEGEQTVTLRRRDLAAGGTVYETRDLTWTASAEGLTKPLADLACVFLGGRGDGRWVEFELPEVKPGKYELLADFVLAYSYGIVELSVDGTTVGDRFDGYLSEVDKYGERASFGTVELGPGPHKIRVSVVGKNEAATQAYIGVKRFVLKPR